MEKGVQKWKENTSTSPSTKHLGHYSCLLIPDNNKKDTTIEEFNKKMLYIHNIKINTALHLGYHLARCTSSEIIMLPKDKYNIQINRLRVIHKYEADFNLVLKYFWLHEATRKANKEGILGDNQWGTIPLCSVEQSALIDELITNINRITCHNLAKL